MKVKVEIEVPDQCEMCKFFYQGTLYCWCKLPDDMMLLEHTYDGRSADCPLDKCEKVVESEQ